MVPAGPSIQTATATCPAGKRIAGGGVSTVSGPNGEAHLNASAPEDGPDSDSRPDDGWTGWHANIDSGPHTLYSYAICTGRRVVSRRDTGRAAVGTGKSVKAHCPDGTRVSAGGAFVGGDTNDGYVNRTFPFDDGDRNSKPDDGWKVRGFNIAGAGSGDWVTATAICVEARLKYRSSSSAAGTLFCPSGTHAVGGGASIAGGASQAHVRTLSPFGKNPPTTASRSTCTTTRHRPTR